MSEREREPRGWRFYVEDMIGFCERVRDYTDGLDQSANGIGKKPLADLGLGKPASRMCANLA